MSEKPKRECRTYRVGTFWHPELRPHLRALAYLRDYSPQWKGCIEYTIKAHDGKTAKKIAAKRRREHEEKAPTEAGAE